MDTRFVAAAVLICAIVLLGSAGCNKPTAAAQPAPREAGASVKTTSPERRTIHRTIEQPGQIVAIEQTPIHARVPGYISEVAVDMNSVVKKGQVLARISVPELDQALLQKKSQLEQAKALLLQAQASELAAEAAVELSRAGIVEAEAERLRVNADRDFRKVEYERYVTLRKENAIRSEIVDEKQNQLLAAESAIASATARIASSKASLKVEQAKLAKAKADVEAAKANIGVARSNVEESSIMLAYREIIAPFDGVVTQRNVHTGHLVKPGQTGNPEPLFVLVRNDRVRVFVDVPEVEASSILSESDSGTRATIARLHVQSSRKADISAPVTRTSWTLDPANRTLRVEIELPTAGTDLRPGMYMYSSFTIEQADAWCLPASSILTKDSGNFVYRVEQGKAVLTPVRIGIREADVVEILKRQVTLPTGTTWEDCRGTERVVAANPGAMLDGQPVTAEAP